MILKNILLCAQLILASAAFTGTASAADPTPSQKRAAAIAEARATYGDVTLGELEDRKKLIKLLRSLDFFSTCNGRQLNGTAVDFLHFNVVRLADEFNHISKKTLDEGDLLSEAGIFDKINRDKELYSSKKPKDVEEAKQRIRKWTVNEFLAAMPEEIKYYDMIVRVACELTKTDGFPKINVQGLAWKNLKTNYDQGALVSGPASAPQHRDSALHIYPEGKIFDVPEAYLEDTIAAFLSHELVHGLQQQRSLLEHKTPWVKVEDWKVKDYSLALRRCNWGEGVLTGHSREVTTRLQLSPEVLSWYDQWRKENDVKIKAETSDKVKGSAKGAAIGGSAGAIIGKTLLGGKTLRGAVIGATIGGHVGIPEYVDASVASISSSEYEADYEGVALACHAGFKLAGFKLLIKQIDPQLFTADSGFTGDPRDVLKRIDHVAQHDKARKARDAGTCMIHPDSRLRWINVDEVAKQVNCPESAYQPRPESAVDAPKQGAGKRVPDQPGADNGTTVSPRIKALIEKCRRNDQCIKVVAQLRTPKVEVKGQHPGPSTEDGDRPVPDGNQPRPSSNPVPTTPAQTPGTADSPGDVSTTVSSPNEQGPLSQATDPARPRVTVSHMYCDVSKLAGKWKGLYIHTGVGVPFELTLRRIGGLLAGESTEPDTRPGKSGMVDARWAGALSPQGMVFERQYLVDTSFVTQYFGYCNSDNTAITGDWMISGTTAKGKFELLKQP